MNYNMFSEKLIEDRIGYKTTFLDKIDNLIDWRSILLILKEIHLRDKSNKGPKPYSKLSMIKAILIQQWYNLSDVELENNLRDRLSFIRFCEFNLEDSVPDHSTISRFRKKMIKAGIHKKLLIEVNNQLEINKVTIKSGAVIDASLIQAHSRPGRKELVEVEPTGDEENSAEVTATKLIEKESKDSDARWIKKGKKYLYGYKANVSVDLEKGIIQEIITTSANVHDTKTFPDLIQSLKLPSGSYVLADKGYSSKNNRTNLRSMKYKSGIMYKRFKTDILQLLKVRFNKHVSKYRYIVEQTFGCLHAHYNFGRTPYVGLQKTDYFLTMKSVAFNLKKMLTFVT